jgi:hypothetical protein
LKRGETKLGTTRPVLIHIPLELLQKLDEAADLFGMYRAEVIRRSLKRELTTVLGDEVQRMERYMKRKISNANSSSAVHENSQGRWRWFSEWFSNDIS